MAKRSKKYTILGGVKVSSRQLAEWGSSGGRPKKYASNAEKQRAYKLRKKQERLGPEAQLEPRKTYGKEIISKYLTCPSCGKVNYDLSQYFNEKGEYIPETYWFDTVQMEKRNIRENEYHCLNCYQVFSFHSGKIKAQATKKIFPRAGTNAERQKRFYDKSKT